MAWEQSSVLQPQTDIRGEDRTLLRVYTTPVSATLISQMLRSICATAPQCNFQGYIRRCSAFVASPDPPVMQRTHADSSLCGSPEIPNLRAMRHHIYSHLPWRCHESVRKHATDSDQEYATHPSRPLIRVPISPYSPFLWIVEVGKGGY